MGSYFKFLVMLFCFSCTAQAQFPVNVDAVRKSVVFIFAPDAEGHVNKAAPMATAFIVEVPRKSDPKRAYRLLVTARHVLDPVWASCPPHHNPTRVFLRLNKINFNPGSDDEGTAYVPLSLVYSGKNKNVFTNVDDSVDAVVVALDPKVVTPDEYDLIAIGVYDFATPEEIKALDSGTEVVSAGLLPLFPGSRRNYPIFKFGHISAVPQERIQVPCAPGEPPNLLRLWFMALNLVQGNSGSPVISVPERFSDHRAALLGLQSTSVEGSDVAGMTPVHFIFEIIESMADIMKDANLYRGSLPQEKKP